MNKEVRKKRKKKLIAKFKNETTIFFKRNILENIYF